MNWKKRFDQLIIGDKVRMVKPCLKCISTNEAGKRHCWEENFKDKELIIDKNVHKDNEGRNVVHIKVFDGSSSCFIEPECFERC